MGTEARIAAAVAASILAACASPAAYERAMALSNGDSKDKALQTMGTPEDRQFKGRSEAWQYSRIATIGVCEYTVLFFNSDLLVGIKSYRNTSSMGCRAGIRPIDWESAPDTTIEVRSR